MFVVIGKGYRGGGAAVAGYRSIWGILLRRWRRRGAFAALVRRPFTVIHKYSTHNLQTGQSYELVFD